LLRLLHRLDRGHKAHFDKSRSHGGGNPLCNHFIIRRRAGHWHIAKRIEVHLFGSGHAARFRRAFVQRLHVRAGFARIDNFRA
jgi:hypothetical protein